jgi:hypothetical protein
LIRKKKEDGLVAITTSINRVQIRLTEERWSHIIDHHPEIERFLDEILFTVSNPRHLYLFAKKYILAATNSYSRLQDYGLPTNIVVHYKEFKDDGFILTAFVMSDERLGRRFKNWKKLK